MHRKDKPVHSLTARSISKPVREQLKNQENIDVTSTELGNISSEQKDVDFDDGKSKALCFRNQDNQNILDQYFTRRINSNLYLLHYQRDMLNLNYSS